MRERLVALARALASMAGLGAILAGPPLALVRFVGNPLPSSVPDIGEIGDALTRTGIADRTVIKILALLAWLVWSQIAAAVCAEIAGQIRNRPAPSLPVIPGLQIAARHLVAGVVFVSVVASAGRTSANASPVPPPPVTAIADDAARPTQTSPPARSSPAVGAEQQPSPTTEYVVQRHDSLWSIAEAILGDGFRWREIRDRNIGRPQPEGGSLTATSDVIHPGWTLGVPSPEPEGRPSPATPMTHEVQPGEHLWRIAEDTLEGALQREASDRETDPYWREVVEANRSGLPDPDNPNLIHAGHIVVLPDPPSNGLPPDAAAAPSAPEPVPDEPIQEPGAVADSGTPPPSTPTATTPPTTASAPPVRDDGTAELDDVDDEDNVAIPAGLLGVAGTGLAAAVAITMLRRRRDRQARATPGHVVPPAPDDLLETHREVLARADLDQEEEVGFAMSEISVHVAGRRRGRCRPRLVQVSADRIDVLLDEPDVDPPPRWAAEGSGEVWTRARVEEVDAMGTCVAPLLVSIGSPGVGTELLYDLEAAGCTSLSGQSDAVQALLRSMLREVVHRSEETVVFAIGDVPAPDDPRIRRADTWDDIADDALAWAHLSADALAAHKLDSAFLARGSGRSVDGTVPILVVCQSLPEDERFDELIGLAKRGAAVAVLVASDQPAGPGTRIVLDHDRLAIPALGLELDAQGIDDDVAADIDALVEAADAPAQQPEPKPEPESTPLSSAGGQPYIDPEYAVLIRVLGQISSEGGREPLKPKQLGLLTYIATHPGCSAEQVEEALWPDPISTRRHRLHITLSQIRSAIGSQHVPRFEDDGSYRVADTVRTDLDLFERRIKHADARDPDEAIPILRGALELVKGPPFTYNARGRQSFTWVDSEHWTSMTDATVVKAAWDLWELCTDAEDYDGAIWAAHRGLLASPTHTELTNCLLRAYAARGDLDAAERVYRSHYRALDHLGLGDPEDSTVELWDELSVQSTSASP